MNIYDLVPFHNETEILTARVRLLAGLVDRHVVMEAHQTHQGDPRPLHEHDPGGELAANVEWHAVDLPAGDGDGANWTRERFQRDALATALGAVHSDHLALSCDVDELVNPIALESIADATANGPVRLGMRMLYYGLDWEDPRGWAHPVAFRARDMPDSLSELRHHSRLPVLPGCGWHVSYWGGIDRRQAKLKAFAHAENSAPDVTERILTGHKTGTGPNGETLVPVDRSTLPALLVEMLG